MHKTDTFPVLERVVADTRLLKKARLTADGAHDEIRQRMVKGTGAQH
jgi:hypothetical protein